MKIAMTEAERRLAAAETAADLADLAAETARRLIVTAASSFGRDDAAVEFNLLGRGSRAETLKAIFEIAPHLVADYAASTARAFDAAHEEARAFSSLMETRFDGAYVESFDDLMDDLDEDGNIEDAVFTLSPVVVDLFGPNSPVLAVKHD